MRTDLNLHAAVSGALRTTLGPAASKVTVNVQDGVVTLSGVVDTPDDKVAAERAMQREPGAHAVVVTLQVANGHGNATDDEGLAHRALDALTTGEHPIGRDVIIRVEKGWLILTGTVATTAEYAAVERALECVEGAHGMRSEVRVADAHSGTPGCVVAPSSL